MNTLLALRQASGSWGGLTSLIHAVGHIHQDVEENISEAVFPYMKTWGGTIIHFGSDVAAEPLPLLAHFAASKGAVQGFVRSIAREWGESGIRANAVLPAFWTPMIEDYRRSLQEESVAGHDHYMNDRVCLEDKFGNAEIDLVPVIAILVSDTSRWITGQLIPVNGGLSVVR